jgi:hypothetical protein
MALKSHYQNGLHTTMLSNLDVVKLPLRIPKLFKINH